MKQFTDVACTVCGCVCDDLTITVENERITRAERACALAEPWFLSQNVDRPPIAQIEGKSVSLDDALDRAAEILKQARSPLIYGLSRSTTEGQRAAVALADRLRAVIDTTATLGHAPALMALQQVGESTCSLGEIKNRADLVIYWASDPLTTHPRHLERYAVEPTGMFVPNGRRNRFVVVVGNEENETAKVADLFLRIDPGKDWEALWTLRGLIAGILPVPENSLKGNEEKQVHGASLQQLRALAERMKTCRCGIVFFGAELTAGRLGHRRVEALLQLVTDLNAHTRFYARRMHMLGDVAGADSVLTWQTGYSFAVNFNRGYSRYNPGEFSAPDMLSRGEIDACLFVGSETSADFPKAALEQLRRIPVIAIESPATECGIPAAVRFTTAVYGIHRQGTACRMDDVSIPLRVLLPTDYPSDGEVLNGLLLRIGRE